MGMRRMNPLVRSLSDSRLLPDQRTVDPAEAEHFETVNKSGWRGQGSRVLRRIDFLVRANGRRYEYSITPDDRRRRSFTWQFRDPGNIRLGRPVERWLCIDRNSIGLRSTPVRPGEYWLSAGGVRCRKSRPGNDQKKQYATVHRGHLVVRFAS